MRKGIALVAGATGITGGNLASHLVASGWTVYGLSRRATDQSGVIPVAADLLDESERHLSLVGCQVGPCCFASAFLLGH